jgi:hypothetical protein
MIMELQSVSSTAKASSSNFTGDVYVNRIYRGEEPSRMTVSLVRFTPGARTNWHSHAVGVPDPARHRRHRARRHSGRQGDQDASRRHRPYPAG